MASIINSTDTGSGGLITTGDSSDELQLQTAEVARVTLTNTAVVVNESGANVDFRVEGDTDANLLFVDASTDRVGIGTSSPGSALEIKKGSSPQVNVNSTSAGFPGLTFALNGVNDGGVFYNQTDDRLEFYTGDTSGNPEVVITSAGNVGIGTSSPAVKLDVVGQVRASTGILFGTDTAAANALDDYEEGTWTPTISDAGSGGNNASGYGSIREGRYVKIGNRVFIWCAVAKNGSVGMTSGNAASITGLPFTNRSIASNWYTPLACIAYDIDFPAGANGIAGNVNSNSTTITIFFNVDNNDTLALTVAQWGDGIFNAINLSGFYEVA